MKTTPKNSATSVKSAGTLAGADLNYPIRSLGADGEANVWLLRPPGQNLKITGQHRDQPVRHGQQNPVQFSNRIVNNWRLTPHPVLKKYGCHNHTGTVMKVNCFICKRGDWKAGHSRSSMSPSHDMVSLPGYADTAALPPARNSVFWKYKGIYLQGDGRVGQWSNIESIAVAG